LQNHPGLVIKESYWRWPERNCAGNAIDFLVQVFGLTFHEAMREILQCLEDRESRASVASRGAQPAAPAATQGHDVSD